MRTHSAVQGPNGSNENTEKAGSLLSVVHFSLLKDFTKLYCDVQQIHWCYFLIGVQEIWAHKCPHITCILCLEALSALCPQLVYPYMAMFTPQTVHGLLSGVLLNRLILLHPMFHFVLLGLPLSV